MLGHATLHWEPHPDVWLLVAVLAGGYLLALRRWGPIHAPGRKPATSSQRAVFLLGVGTLWLGADWPVHELAESYLYSVHMGQHMLFQFLAAPLLILGTPPWLLRRLLRPPVLFATVRAVTRPVPALLLVSGFVAATHVPAAVNLAAASEPVHLLLHVTLLGVSLVMWWPVLSPLPELPHLSYLGRIGYLFGHSVLPTVPASFLTFTDWPLYRAYAEAPRIVAWLDPVQDQQIAGLLMKIGAGLLLWTVIAVLFFRWVQDEQSGGPDPLYWRGLEPDIESARQVQ